VIRFGHGGCFEATKLLAAWRGWMVLSKKASIVLSQGREAFPNHEAFL